MKLFSNLLKRIRGRHGLSYDGFNTWIKHSKHSWECANLKALWIEPIPSDYDMTKEEVSKTRKVIDITAFDKIAGRL